MSYSRRFEAALVFATQLHHGQLRKGTTIPYSTHLLAVAALVGEAGGTEDEAIAALLHDAVEDGGGKPVESKIRELFGDAVAEIVVGCSDTDITPKPPWKERKDAYIADLQNHSPSVLLVSCADKLHNARSLLADYREIGEALWDRFTGKKDGTLWYYRTLLEVYQRRSAPERLVAELERVVSELERLAAK